jgi:hypothetical protein
MARSVRARRSRLLCLAVGVAAVASGGCATSYVYSPGRDQQAQAAVKAAAETKLVETVTSVEKRFAGLTDLEVDAARKRFALIREQEIRAVGLASAPVTQLQTRMNARFADLVGAGGDPAKWDAIVAATTDVSLQTSRVEEAASSFFETLGVQSPDCAAAASSPSLPDAVLSKIAPALRSQAPRLYTQVQTTCQTHAAAKAKYDAAIAAAGGGGRYAVAVQQLAADREVMRARNAARQAAAEALNAAVARYTAEVAAVSTSSALWPDKARINEALKRLDESIAAIENVQGQFGRELIAKERLAKLEGLVNGFAQGRTDAASFDPETKKAIAVVGTLPALADEARRSLADAQKPRLLPYVLAKEHQRLLVQDATNVEAILTRRVDASSRIVDAYQAEIIALVTARKNIQAGWLGKTAAQLDALDARDKRNLYEQLGVYFDEIPRLQTEEWTLEYRRLGTFQEEAIEHSKHAALMWQNLVDNVAATLASYHAAGLKPETIAEFGKALGLLLLGVGAL